jgi:hypothetical protein
MIIAQKKAQKSSKKPKKARKKAGKPINRGFPAIGSRLVDSAFDGTR